MPTVRAYYVPACLLVEQPGAATAAPEPTAKDVNGKGTA